MTVPELIERLKAMPQDAVVQLWDADTFDYVDVSEVEDWEDGTVCII